MPEIKEVAAVDSQKCEKCGKTMKISKFYKYKDGRPMELCKACLTMHMDAFDPETYLWAIKKADVPYIPSQWNSLRNAQFEKDPNHVNTMVVFGKYLSVMKLNPWRKYGWADTEKLQEEMNEKEEKTKEEREEYEEQLKEQKDAGLIPEAEYLTYVSTETRKKEADMTPPPTMEEAIGEDNYYNENDFLSEDELPDPAAGLTQEDRVYLAMKWGNSYKPNEQIELEKKYNEMKRDFVVEDSDTEGTLILCCKTFLKMNQAIDCSDIESFQKLSKVFDSLRKSAMFTAAQKKKENKESFVDCVGNLVKYCEKVGGVIPKYDLSINLDKFDEVIKDMKQYTKDLIYEDHSLARQIEDYLKKKEILEKRKAEEEEAKKKGLDYREIPMTEEEYLESVEMKENDKAEDEKIYSGEGESK